jgi:PAS domain S-box-containing protein
VLSSSVWTRSSTRSSFYQTLVDNSPIAIVSLDAKQCIQSCNPAFEELFGYSMGESCGQMLDALITKPDEWLEASTYTERILTGETIKTSGQRVRKDGQVLEVEIYGVPVRVRTAAGVIAMYQDITTRCEPRAPDTWHLTRLPCCPTRPCSMTTRCIGSPATKMVAVFFLDLDGFQRQRPVETRHGVISPGSRAAAGDPQSDLVAASAEMSSPSFSKTSAPISSW